MKNSQKKIVLKKLNEIHQLTSMKELLKEKIDHNDLSVAKNSKFERGTEITFILSGATIIGSLIDLIPLIGDPLYALMGINIFSFTLFSFMGTYHFAGKIKNKNLLSCLKRQFSSNTINILEYQKEIDNALKNKIKLFKKNKENINICIKELSSNPEYEKHKEFLLTEILEPILKNESKLLSLNNDDNLKIEIS